jgi:HK97 family phage portal protein
VSLIRRAFAATERRSNEFGDSTPPAPGMSAFSGDGSGVSEGTALQVMAVYGSVGVIADGLSSLPWQRFSSPDPAKRRPLPLTQILKQPYVEISRTDWLTQYAMSMALRGNFYGQVLERDQDFYPTQIKPVHPDRARVRRLPGGQVEYRFNNTVVPVDDVFHIRYLSAPGSLVGLNPIENLRVPISLARSQDIYGASYFDNSANPEGVLETEDDLDPDEVLALAQRWIAAHGGIYKAHLPAVLTNGVKFSPISVNPKDSQFLESRQYSASTISGMIFRVPPHMIGIVDRTTSWGTGIEQQERGFVTNTLGGYIGRLEEAIDGLHPGDEYCRLDLSARLRGDKLQRSQAHALDLAAGWINADEVRDDEDMAPMPDGQGKFFHTPINSELLAQALQSLKDSQAAAPADPADQTGGADA